MKHMRGFVALALGMAMVLGFAAPSVAATIKALVNGTQITDVQVAERARLMKLERRGSSDSNRLKLALSELVDETLELQEGQRIGITVTDAQVSKAFGNLALRLKISADKLNQVLLSSGVNPDTLKDRLRAQLAWQQVVQALVAPRVNLSDAQLEKQAKSELKSYDNFDYILKQILFVIPAGSKESTSRRTAQANQYRKSFTGCAAAVDLSLAYTDVAVIDVGRRHATQLPDAVAKELGSLKVGQLTKPRVASGGVSMLAICAKDAAQDTSFLKNQLSQKEGTDKLKAAADEYLASLRKKAAITYR